MLTLKDNIIKLYDILLKEKAGSYLQYIDGSIIKDQKFDLNNLD